MSDSINEQRCERNGLPVSGCAASEYDCAKFGVCAASPSVVTPPAQDGQREFVTYGPTPLPAAPSVSTDIDNLRAENARLTRERDLAIAHDTQPYPTAWAYEQACRVMHETKAERDALQAEVEELRRRKRAAEFWERLVRTVVARPEWRTFYEADERGACDEVMIDYLAALQARIDAAKVIAETEWGHLGNPYDRILAALGVDPQKEEP